MTERVVATGRRVRRPTLTLEERTLPVEAWADMNYVVRCLADTDFASVVQIRDTLLPYTVSLKSNIYFWNQHGVRSLKAEPEAEGLNVVFWSAPFPEEHRSTERKYKKVFGYTLDAGQDDGYQYSERDKMEGEVIEDGEAQSVAILTDNILYIAFDLPHRSPNAVKVLEAIMDKVVELKGTSPATKAEKEQKKLSDLVGKIVNGKLEKEIVQAKANVTSHQRTLASYSNEISGVSANLVSAQRQVARLELEQKAFSVDKVISSIMQVPGVLSVAPYRTALRVKVDAICIDTDVARYRIGQFAIDYLPNGDYVIHNLEKSKSATVDYDHPHVFNGKPCLGNVAAISVNVASGELDVSTALIMEFLRNYHPSGAFTTIDKWPRIADIKNGEVRMLPEPILYTPDEDRESDDEDSDDGDDD